MNTFYDFADQYCEHIDDTVRYHLLMVYIRYYPSYEIPKILCQNRDRFMNSLFERNKSSERGITYCDESALSFCDKFQEWFEHQFPELMQDEYYAGKRFSHSVCEDYGTTPIVQWIKYAHRKPILPDELGAPTGRRPEGALSSLCERRHPYEELPKQLTFGKWLCKRHFVDRGHPGYQPIHYWIMYRQGEPIPQQLLFKGVEKTKHDLGQTPLYMWIRYRPGEPIPNQLKYEGWQKDESVKTFTPLMMWLRYRPTEPIPEDIMYDDWKTYSRMESPYSFESSTPLFVWANNHPEKPIPEALVYEGCGSALSERGDTLLHAWMDKMCERYTPFLMKILEERQMLKNLQIPELVIPEALKFPGWQLSRNRNNKTPIAIYVQRWPRAAEMPAEMLYDGCQDDITGENSNLLTCWFANYNVMRKPVEPPEWILPKKPVSNEIKLKWYLTWVQNPYNDLGHIPSILLDECVLQPQPPNVKNPTRKFGKAVTRYLNTMGHVEDEIYKSVFVFRQWCDGVKNIPNEVSFPEELKQLINDHIPDQVQRAKRSPKQ